MKHLKNFNQLNESLDSEVDTKIKEYGWDDDVMRAILVDVFAEEPDNLEALSDMDSSDLTAAIAQWIQDGKFNIDDWFKEVDSTYNEQ